MLQLSWYRSVGMQAIEWMTAEQAAKHFEFASAKAFEKTVSREGIPKHYLSVHAPRYNRVELDKWLMTRREGLHR
jgi:polyphosphate kinase 2 (PPK2 family)